MVLSGVTTYDKDRIRVFDIAPVVGHRTAPERLCQSRNCCAVSDTCLVIKMHQAEAAHTLMDDCTLLIIHL
jgi:hypothetical protein